MRCSVKSSRILCAADIHLGRRLLRLPEGIDDLAQAPKHAWNTLVEFTINRAEEIDALVLAGDIFDNEHNLYEVMGVFEKGARKILEAKIPIVAVAGNHDGKILEKSMKRIGSPDFHLLGREGRWESVVLPLKGQEVRFLGWSFPGGSYNSNPLKDFPVQEPSPLTIAVLHCDVGGGKQSIYAPVELGQLVALPVQAWVLGHVHIGAILAANPLTFYCGSLQGLDPSECGPRGATLLEVERSGKITKEILPLGQLLFYQHSVDISSIPFSSLDQHLSREIQSALKTLPPSVKAVMCRFLLKGRSPSHAKLSSFSQEIEGSFLTQVGETAAPCFIESIAVRCTPSLDLASLARGRDLPALLATLLLSLDQGEQVGTSLIEEAARFVKTKIEKNSQSEIALFEAEESDKLIQIGYEVLEMLLSQQEA